MRTMDFERNSLHPVRRCGFGQNLYVEPSGESFPCYAYHRPHAYLGNVIRGDLQTVLNSEQFQDLSCHNVDSNPKCRICEFRYLCGGACRAWGGEAAQHELDAPPPECNGLRDRAIRLHEAALQYIEAYEQAKERRWV